MRIKSSGSSSKDKLIQFLKNLSMKTFLFLIIHSLFFVLLTFIESETNNFYFFFQRSRKKEKIEWNLSNE